MNKRNHLNFSGGPGALPEAVLEQVKQAVVELPETGLSVLGMSHRSRWFYDVLEESEAALRALLGVPSDYSVVFLQGGGSLQFSMIPSNFAAGARRAPEYVISGYWSRKALHEASKASPIDVVWDGERSGYRTLPDWALLERHADAPYRHYVSNETVEGLQFQMLPPSGTPLIVDMSSDLLSRPIDVRAFGMIYAHAQKNIGPAGVTVSIIDNALLERIPDSLPPMLDYRTHVKHHSNYNTPPVFAIYVMLLVLRWLRDDVGGVEPMQRVNAHKASMLYSVLDELHEVIACHVDKSARSTMNATFRFKKEVLDALFIERAQAAGFAGLEGHRSIGGMRASLYNAVSEAAVQQLCAFTRDFCLRHA